MKTNHMRISECRDMPSACRITYYGIAQMFYASAITCQFTYRRKEKRTEIQPCDILLKSSDKLHHKIIKKGSCHKI